MYSSYSPTSSIPDLSQSGRPTPEENRLRLPSTPGSLSALPLSEFEQDKPISQLDRSFAIVEEPASSSLQNIERQAHSGTSSRTNSLGLDNMYRVEITPPTPPLAAIPTHVPQFSDFVSPATFVASLADMGIRGLATFDSQLPVIGSSSFSPLGGSGILLPADQPSITNTWLNTTYSTPAPINSPLVTPDILVSGGCPSPRGDRHVSRTVEMVEPQPARRPQPYSTNHQTPNRQRMRQGISSGNVVPSPLSTSIINGFLPAPSSSSASRYSPTYPMQHAGSPWNPYTAPPAPVAAAYHGQQHTYGTFGGYAASNGTTPAPVPSSLGHFGTLAQHVTPTHTSAVLHPGTPAGPSCQPQPHHRLPLNPLEATMNHPAMNADAFDGSQSTAVLGKKKSGPRNHAAKVANTVKSATIGAFQQFFPPSQPQDQSQHDRSSSIIRNAHAGSPYPTMVERPNVAGPSYGGYAPQDTPAYGEHVYSLSMPTGGYIGSTATPSYAGHFVSQTPRPWRNLAQTAYSPPALSPAMAQGSAPANSTHQVPEISAPNIGEASSYPNEPTSASSSPSNPHTFIRYSEFPASTSPTSAANSIPFAQGLESNWPSGWDSNITTASGSGTASAIPSALVPNRAAIETMQPNTYAAPVSLDLCTSPLPEAFATPDSHFHVSPEQWDSSSLTSIFPTIPGSEMPIIDLSSMDAGVREFIMGLIGSQQVEPSGMIGQQPQTTVLMPTMTSTPTPMALTVSNTQGIDTQAADPSLRTVPSTAQPQPKLREEMSDSELWDLYFNLDGTL
jgi:hypothetical protein